VTRSRLLGFAVAAAACALLAAQARALQQPAATDAELQRRVLERLSKAGLDQRADIQVQVAAGAVHLTGVAVSYADYREAERAARKEARSVDNEVKVVPEEPRSDKAIGADARREVLAWERYGAFDAVSVEVHEGMVTLKGWVDTPVKKDEIDERLAHVAGVRDVHNDLHLQGFSEADRRLRAQIYSRIYGDPMFERWAGVPDPPVRIFVSRGRITLAGLVGSKVEKVTAGNIARATLGFSVDNQLQIESDVRRKEDRKKPAADES
jgi:osmotically-inducible protein OsmY